MAELTDFIHIYDDKLNSNSCDTLINFFEETTSESNELNLTDIKDSNEEVSTIHNEVLKIVINSRNEYYNYCCGKVFPEMNSFEKFIIKKISPDDEVDINAVVDVKSYDDARRFLCFTFYLNNNTGGQTNFLDLTIQPEVGKLLIYPPFWLFPHQELTPIGIPKYTLETYLHYK
jgi:prolyl 4-hydroxylase